MDISKFFPLIGIVIFIVVLLNVNLSEIANSIMDVSPVFLILAITLHIPIVLLKAGKWKIITHTYERAASFPVCVHAWLVGFVIGIVTPGRLGEITKVYYIKERMSLGRGIATVVIDRIIDILVLFILAISGTVLFIYKYSGFLQANFTLPLIIFFFVFLLSTFFILTRGDIVKKLAKPMFRRFVPGKHKSSLKNAFHDFYLGLKEIRKRGYLVVLSVAISLIYWSIIILQFKLISLALSLQIDYFFLLSVMPVVILLDTLPISFSGLGTREIALIFFLGILSVPIEAVISFSVLIFLFSYLVLVPFGLLFWFIKPIKIKI
jgi:uncharacterized protein (TIRG00374 family)